MLVDAKTLGKISILEKTYNDLRYFNVSHLETEYAQTFEHFRNVFDSDRDLEWKSISGGDRWGESWLSAWFRVKLTLPVEYAGGPVFLRAQTGATEALMIVNGKHMGVFDYNHPVHLVDMNPGAGQVFDIYLEGYSGHTFPGTQPYDRSVEAKGGEHQDSGLFVGKNCRVFQSIDLVSERKDVSEFVFKLQTLRQLANALDSNSLRRGQIQKALQQVFILVDAKPEETDESVWRPKISEAVKILNPLLALKNGPSAPKAGITGHSHIDTAWLWPIAETERKLARTFSSVLSLMEQYPEFRFTQSAAFHGDVVRRKYPEIFERIKQRVAEGRWEINGAMWVEPDCNISGGEALVRQCLYGQLATREMFGVTSDTLWQPDAFGFSGALPQILKGCGVKYFCTTKMGWNDTNRFPYETFIWEGVDGSSVLSHFNISHCIPDPETLINAWNSIQHKDIQDRGFVAFGYGDGGGGPMAEMIEMARLAEDLEGCPRASYSSVSEFMSGIENDFQDLPTWKGELYLELHRGTLTSVSEVKRLNRKSELALRFAEFSSVLSSLLKGAAYPKESLDTIWKEFLVNQFHDILPGSSIARVNDEAIASLTRCVLEAEDISTKNIESLPQKGELQKAIAIVNDLSWERGRQMKLSGIPAGYKPQSAIKAQVITDIEGKQALLTSGVKAPSLGFVIEPLEPFEMDESSSFKADSHSVETPFATIVFGNDGEIVSFIDKSAERQLVKRGDSFNLLLLGEDVPQSYDNWDVDRDQHLKLAPKAPLLSQKVIENGSLELRIRQERKLGQYSSLTQDIIFHSESPLVEFETLVNWSEKYQLFKAHFGLDVLAETARHEIQYGHISRTTHENTSYDRAQFEVCAHKWTDISETGYGVAFINDGKYACSVKNGAYELTLIKSGRHPDDRGDQGIHRFSYAILPHEGGFSVGSVVRPAYEFNIGAACSIVSDSSAQSLSLATLDSENVIVESIKWAEKGDAFVMRIYEASKTGSHVALKLGAPVKSASETNMLEEEPKSLALVDNSLSLYFRPLEIKTLRFEV